jgi:predicted O-methyltransferase YrrM
MNREILTQIAYQALASGQMVANYPDPDNPKVTFPPSPYYRFLRLLAHEMNSRLSVELGVCGGGGSLHLAMGSQKAVGIDVTYEEYYDNLIWLTKHHENLHLFIDILFIDTTHTLDQTLSEYRAYEPYLSNRAVVILDDLFRPGMDDAWGIMPEPKIRFDFLHPSQSPTDGGFGVVWSQSE